MNNETAKLITNLSGHIYIWMSWEVFWFLGMVSYTLLAWDGGYRTGPHEPLVAIDADSGYVIIITKCIYHDPLLVASEFRSRDWLVAPYPAHMLLYIHRFSWVTGDISLIDQPIINSKFLFFIHLYNYVPLWYICSFHGRHPPASY